MTTMRTFTVVLSPDPNRGGYSASVPAVPGAISEGDTRDAALAGVREAVAGILEHGIVAPHTVLTESPHLVAAEIEKVLAFRAEEGWDLLVETATIELSLAAVA
jgi:predicted RNase H-like HicB family nuclease